MYLARLKGGWGTGFFVVKQGDEAGRRRKQVEAGNDPLLPTPPHQHLFDTTPEGCL